jgi:uncharacterized protein
MKFEWDEGKNQTNIRKRGLDFADAPEMFDGPMLISVDDREDYGEERYIGFGLVQSRLMVVVYTERKPDIIRIISFRKANSREKVLFEKTIKNRLG